MEPQRETTASFNIPLTLGGNKGRETKVEIQRLSAQFDGAEGEKGEELNDALSEIYQSKLRSSKDQRHRFK